MLTTLPLSRHTPPAAGGPSRQLYMLLREAPDRAAATAYLQRRLAEAAALPPAWSGGLAGLENWLELRARSRADEFRHYQAARAGGAPRRHFATLAQARRFLCVQAPALLADGAWLHCMLDHWRQPAYLPLVKLYLDYLGQGVPPANHVAQVRQALAVQACGNWQDLDDAGFVQGAIRLALACAGERFLPELLGYQLAVADQPAAQPSLLQELGELGIALPAPPPTDAIVLNALRILPATPAAAAAFLQRLETGHGLGRIGLQTLPATPEDGAPQDEPAAGLQAPAVFAPPAGAAAHGAVANGPAGSGVAGAGAAANGAGAGGVHANGATARPASRASLRGSAAAADDNGAGGPPDAPRAILRHAFPADEHAWETISNDLGLLEAQIAACASKAEAMAMLARHMGPALHHQPLGLMAARVYSQLFALV